MITARLGTARCAAAFTAPVAAGLQWGHWAVAPAVCLLNTAVAVSLVVLGALLAKDPRMRGSAPDLAGAALCYLVLWWASWPATAVVGPQPLAASVVGYLWLVLAFRGLARYLDPRASRRVLTVAPAVAAGWIVGGRLVLSVIAEPSWLGFAGGWWWPPTLVDRDLFDRLRPVVDGGIVVAAAALLVGLVVLAWRAGPLDRRDTAPVVAAVIGTGLCGVGYLVVLIGRPDHTALPALRVAVACAALTITLAFLVSVLRRRLARSEVVAMIEQLPVPATAQDVQGVLRRALRDPSLTVRVPDTGSDHAALHRPDSGHGEPDPGRWHHRLQTSDGAALATVSLDRSLHRHPMLVGAAMAASGHVLEFGRQHTAHLAQLRRSRERVLRAALAERVRIERDLHDGAQQTLLAVGARLAVAAAGPTVTPDTMAQLRADLRLAADQLRELAQGVHPRELTEHGLGAALPELAARCPVPVTCRVGTGRLSPEIEVTLYFVAAEALTNIAKHAGAHTATVSVDRHNGVVRLRVDDDGVGGATTAGSGLTGLADRVATVGGTLTVHSPPGAGTTVQAQVPCG